VTKTAAGPSRRWASCAEEVRGRRRDRFPHPVPCAHFPRNRRRWMRSFPAMLCGFTGRLRRPACGFRYSAERILN